MTNEKAYWLSKVDFLSDLDLQELTELAEDFHWREYTRDSEIMSVPLPGSAG